MHSSAKAGGKCSCPAVVVLHACSPVPRLLGVDGWAGRAAEREERSSTLAAWCGRRQAVPQPLPGDFEAGRNTLTSWLEERLCGEGLSLFALLSL